MVFKTSIYSLKKFSEILVESCSLNFLEEVVTDVENCSKWVWYVVTPALCSIMATHFYIFWIPTYNTILHINHDTRSTYYSC